MTLNRVETKVQISHPSELRRGVQAGAPIALGYLPIAIAFGLLAKSAATPFGIGVLMSGLVYAGASQFMAVQMIMGGTSLLNIIFLTFILNIRHFLMSAALSTRLLEKSNRKLALIAFGITDETFSVHSLNQEKLTFRYVMGVNLTAYFAWMIGTVLGFLVGSGLPEGIQNSMGIALYAMFVGLLIPSVRKSWRVGGIVLIAASINTGLIQFMQTGPAIVLTTIVTAGIATFLFPTKGDES